MVEDPDLVMEGAYRYYFFLGGGIRSCTQLRAEMTAELATLDKGSIRHRAVAEVVKQATPYLDQIEANARVYVRQGADIYKNPPPATLLSEKSSDRKARAREAKDDGRKKKRPGEKETVSERKAEREKAKEARDREKKPAKNASKNCATPPADSILPPPGNATPSPSLPRWSPPSIFLRKQRKSFYLLFKKKYSSVFHAKKSITKNLQNLLRKSGVLWRFPAHSPNSEILQKSPQTLY